MRLNRLMAEEFGVEQYFTLIWAELDLATGQVTLVQAGHPHPLILRAGGGVEVVGQGPDVILIPGGRTTDPLLDRAALVLPEHARQEAVDFAAHAGAGRTMILLVGGLVVGYFMGEPGWHAVSAEDVLTRLSAHSDGLSIDEVAARLAERGRNVLPAGASRTPPPTAF